MAVSRSLRFQILRRDNHTCRYCGRSAPEVKLTVDHVIPEALGGSDDPSNLCAACGDCNGGKSATPPDAAHVADVNEDAHRWAAAMQAAADAMLSDHASRQADRDAFEAAWSRWGREVGGERVTIPLPPEWGATVDRFRAAGLPIEILTECIPPAMTRKSVKDDRRFNYMCGVAWNKVTDLQTAAQQSLGGDDAEPAVDDPAQDLAIEILSQIFYDDERDRLMKRANEYEPDEDDHPFTGSIEELAVRLTIDELATEHLRIRNSVRRLLSTFPDGEDIWQASKDYLASFSDDYSQGELQAEVLDQLAESRERKFLADMPEAERDEWLACACVFHNTDDRTAPYVLRSAAEYAMDVKFRGLAWRTLCGGPGKHGAQCPSQAAYVVFYEDCTYDGCVEQGKCVGHTDFCEQHLEVAVEGRMWRDGSRSVVADFAPVDPRDMEAPF